MKFSRNSETMRGTLKRSLLIALLLGAAIYIASQLSAPGQIAYAAGVVSGTVFRDYNANGVRDTREPGLGGITVKAYNVAGTEVASTTTFPVCVGSNQPVTGCTGVNTPAPGSYSLGSLADGQYRIEFTTTNTGLKPGAFGTGNGTGVQFITVAGAAVNNVNASFNSPRDYCQNNPRLVTPCYIQGNQSGTDGVLFSHAYTDNSPTASPASQQTESQANQIGTTWGLAYRSTTNVLYAAAYLKRTAGFGPGGPGRIYAITPGGAADGTGVFTIPNAGADPHTDYSTSNADSDYDNGAFSLVGKRSLGDIELNADESVLYAINLNDRSLYSVNLATNVITNHGVVPKPTGAGNEGCNARGEGRPFGLGWRDDLLYVGGVCTAETVDTDGVPPNNTGTAADLQAYVYTFNPATNSFSSSPVIQFSLNFNRQCLNISTETNNQFPTCKPNVDRPYAAWRPWRDAYSTIVQIDGAGDNDTYNISGGNGGYPMPMLSDIVFDGNDMILGFRDRNGDMLGLQDPGPTQSQTSPLLNTTGAGDIVRANPNASGGWTIENNSQSNPAGIFGPTTGSGVPQGPGGGEFYLGDNHPNHDETTLGGLAQVPGNGEVVTTILDPSDLWSGGTSQFRNYDTGANDDGQRVRSVELFQSVGPPSSPINARFGKANGLGDLEALCNAAPIEIGNRLFDDYDGDGIQDANEPGISGVQVNLYLDANNDGVPDGAAIGTVTTNSSGQYYFSNDATRTDATGADYGITGLVATQRYLVRVNRASDYGSSGGLYQRYLAPANVNSNNSDSIDSDASLPNSANPPSDTNPPTISVLTGTAGSNDHSYDIGFTPRFSIGNRVYYDTNNNGQWDSGTEVGINGISVSLIAQSTVIVGGTTYTAGQVIATTTTANGSGGQVGYYRFDNLPPGSYSVRVNSSNFTSGSTLAGYNSSGTTVNANTNTTDSRDVGVDDTNSPTNGISSNTFTLGYATAPNGNAPTGEGDQVNSPTTLPTTDNRSNLAIDFGFYRLTVGNTVFRDDGSGAGTANNGVQDGSEPGISGVTVRLFRDTNTNGVIDANELVAVTTTDANGNYQFTQQTDSSGVGNGRPIVPASDYKIQIASGQSALSGFESSADGANAGTPMALDSDDNGIGTGSANTTNTTTNAFTLGTGVTGNVSTNSNGTIDNPQVDFGFVPGYSIGNRVWFDTDNSGTINGSEVGISGVTVALIAQSTVNVGGTTYTAGQTIATMTTNAGGYYRFDSLPAGTYSVSLPASNWTTGAKPLASYQSSTGQTTQNNNNPNTTPDSRDNGNNPSDYTASGVSSSNIILGSSNPAPTGETDGVNSPSTATTIDARANLTVDFGFYRLTVGDTVWNDNGAGGGTANDGVKNGGEVGISGVQVKLFRDGNSNGVIDANELVAVTTTDSNGNYLFTQQTDAAGVGNGRPILPASDYKIQIASGQTALLGFRSSADLGQFATPMNADSDDNGIGTANANTNNTTTNAFTLSNGGSGNPTAPAGNAGTDSTGTVNNPRVDFGFVPLFSIGNRVWFDTDNSGTINGAEVGISGVTVELRNSDNTSTVATTTTDASGYYRFDNLEAGTYRVRLPASNWTTGVTPPLAGYQGSTGQTTQNNNNPNTTADLRDNGDNPADYTASGILSSQIILGASNPAPTGETQTSGVASTSPDARENLTVDFGLYRLTVGNTVFRDDGSGVGTANNGVQDGSEPGISGITVQLLDGTNTVIAVTTTDSNGNYTFTQQTNGAGVGNGKPIPPANNYTIRIPSGQSALLGYQSSADGGNVGTPMASDSDDNGNGTANANTNNTTTSAFILSNGGSGNPAAPAGNAATDSSGTVNNPRVDFGFVPLYSIGNRIWFDDGAGGGTANDGIKQSGESGVSGVTVELRNSSNVVVATTTTNANGYYRFDNVIPGMYNINIPGTMFASGQPLFGYMSSTNGNVTAGNVLANDNKDNGIDDSAPGTNGIHTTNFALGPTDNAPTTESDTSGVAVTTTDNRENLTIDLAFTPAYAIGNRVWFDTDNSGTLNGSEGGISGVTVQLLDGSNNVLATTTTDANGYYRFDTLTPGTYRVRLPASNWTNGGAPLAGYQGSTGQLTQSNNNPNTTTDLQDNGDNPSGYTANGITSTNIILGASNPAPTAESDFVASGNTTAATPNARENLTVDFGLYRLTTSGKVWLDNGAGGGTTNNGMLDGSEGGINNVRVELYKGGTFVAVTMTDNSGNFTFNQQTDSNGSGNGKPLEPGSDYTIVIPSGQTALNNLKSSADVSTTTNPTNTGNGVQNDDNGIGTAANNTTATVSSAFTLDVTTAANTAGAAANNANGTTSQPTLYFGFTPSNPTAALLGPVSATANDNATVTLRWESLSELNALGFNVLRAAKRNGQFVQQNAELIAALTPGDVNGNAYEFTDVNVKPEKSYFYRIELVTIDNTTEQSEPIKVQVGKDTACQGKPDKAILLGPENDSKQNPGKLTFTWNPVNCAATYQVQIRLASPDGELVVESKSLTKTQFSTQKLEKGKTYVWRVQACNADGKCSGSEWWSFKVAKKAQ